MFRYLSSCSMSLKLFKILPINFPTFIIVFYNIQMLLFSDQKTNDINQTLNHIEDDKCNHDHRGSSLIANTHLSWNIKAFICIWHLGKSGYFTFHEDNLQNTNEYTLLDLPLLQNFPTVEIGPPSKNLSHPHTISTR